MASTSPEPGTIIYERRHAKRELNVIDDVMRK